MTDKSPPNEQDLEALLATISGYPTGDPESWKQRYAPLIDEVIHHREPPEPALSVVIVAWNSPTLVIECLDHIRTQAGFRRDDIEVIFVDNGGLQSVRPQVAERVDIELRMIGNVKLCRARNAGVAYAKADLVCFIDDDGLIEPNYFERAVAYFENPNVVAIRSRIIEKHHPYFTTLGDHYDRGPAPVDDCLVTEGSTTLRRMPYIAVGGFAESLAGHEGIDLSYRLMRDDPDARILYAPDVVMRHDYFDSWRKFLRKSFSYADIDATVAARDPDLSSFMAAYARRKFKRSPQPLHRQVARTTLSGLRDVLQIAARLRGKLTTSGRRS